MPQIAAMNRELPLSNSGQLELMRGLSEHGASVRTRVRGASMSPVIHDGDILTIAPLAGADPAVGDIVAVAVPDSQRLIVHRVVRRTATAWVVRGDNCPIQDGLFSAADVLGRVIRVERAGRDVRLGVTVGGRAVAVASRGGLLGALRRALRFASNPSHADDRRDTA